MSGSKDFPSDAVIPREIPEVKARYLETTVLDQSISVWRRWLLDVSWSIVLDKLS